MKVQRKSWSLILVGLLFICPQSLEQKQNLWKGLINSEDVGSGDLESIERKGDGRRTIINTNN